MNVCFLTWHEVNKCTLYAVLLFFHTFQSFHFTFFLTVHLAVATQARLFPHPISPSLWCSLPAAIGAFVKASASSGCCIQLAVLLFKAFSVAKFSHNCEKWSEIWFWRRGLHLYKENSDLAAIFSLSFLLRVSWRECVRSLPCPPHLYPACVAFHVRACALLLTAAASLSIATQAHPKWAPLCSYVSGHCVSLVICRYAGTNMPPFQRRRESERVLCFSVGVVFRVFISSMHHRTIAQ